MDYSRIVRYRPPDILLGATDYTTHIDMWGELLIHRIILPAVLKLDFCSLTFQAWDVYFSVSAH